jgi:hypothetical protein
MSTFFPCFLLFFVNQSHHTKKILYHCFVLVFLLQLWTANGNIGGNTATVVRVVETGLKQGRELALCLKMVALIVLVMLMRQNTAMNNRAVSKQNHVISIFLVMSGFGWYTPNQTTTTTTTKRKIYVVINTLALFTHQLVHVH